AAASTTSAASPTPHSDRNAGREAPAACRDLGAPPKGPPTPLFDPGDVRAQGTDVSDAQGDVPWKTLAEGGIEFIYVRASEGVHIHDRHFQRNWEMAKDCALPRGAYHVFEPTQDVDAQVEHFLSILGEDSGELPAVLDIEITPKMVEVRNAKNRTKDVFPTHEVYMKGVLRWMSKVEAATGMKPMVYIQPWYWHSYLGKTQELTAHMLWAAGSAPRGRDGWAWTFWQHGQPAHWDERIWDRDRFHGGPAELKALLQSERKVADTKK
ncbi:MAG: glycoside hydrolase family 25 protein, partial [Myxococcales bacterium]|nr:glycoside hydrolase family 25 protein [Myxococcales bacterium]